MANNKLEKEINDLNKAYTGSLIKTSIGNLFTALNTLAKEHKLPAKYLGGVSASDFVTRNELYEYFTNGNYFANSLGAEDRTSGKPISTGCFEKYFGNATLLLNDYNNISTIKKGK